jgi:hypothetical protein
LTRLAEIEEHLERDGWRGHDPYDVLCSPLFRLPVLRSNRLIRFGSQQVFRRLPVNGRPLLRIKPQLNPVTVSLYVQGLAHRAQAGAIDVGIARDKVQRAVEVLADAVTSGWSGACWGYPFSWEARYASMPAHTPTIVATCMVTKGLFAAHEILKLDSARELILSACDFVVNDLNRTPGPDGSFCWSYSPRDEQTVLNATAKGSRFLAQAVTLGAPAALLRDAEASARFVTVNQEPTGRWPYAVGDTRGFADLFHTGYVLDSLREYSRLACDPTPGAAIDRGFAYFRSRFFDPDMTPRYYDDRTLPVDATACAQAIITLCEFGEVDAARAAADRAIQLLGMRGGAFAYRRQRWYTNRIHFLRWSTAWMYCALANLQAATADRTAAART